MVKQAWLLSWLCALAMAAPAHADQWNKKYSVAGKPQVRVETNDGSIDVLPSEQNQVEVTVLTEGWRIPQDVRMVESQTGDRIELDARAPGMNFNIWGVSHRTLRITLRVPPQADLDLKTGDGRVTLQPVSGNIRVYTGDGNIEATGLKGDIRLHSGDGHIEASGVDGRLDADSGDGRINVRGRFDVLRLKSGDGRIDAEVQAGSKMASDWSLQSGDGSITLRLPDGFGADLDAHTGDGRITLDFPVTVSGSLGRSTVRGKIAGGGELLQIRTGDGSIHLERF
jgi:DUF4097 and DUF4098 domain-containing protein YvlB